MFAAAQVDVTASEPVPENAARHRVKDVDGFRRLESVDFQSGCDFSLEGIVTLVDTNRDLIVLQDATGAVGLHARWNAGELQAGQKVKVDGIDCSPYLPTWPDFPYRPAGIEIRDDFEIPFDTDEYRLTRMRAYLQPPADGEYQFWIASDNSSELWLSGNANQANAKKIASIGRFEWVDPGEWTRHRSQRSEPVFLKRGQMYYIEALMEQNTGGEHLAVAWSGPSFEREVISQQYLRPWSVPSDIAGTITNGVLREYWTNYGRGDLVGLGGARPFESILTVREIKVQILGRGEKPVPQPLAPGQKLSMEQNLRWMTVSGTVRFASEQDGVALLELVEGGWTLHARVPGLSQEQVTGLLNATVEIHGVCESMPEPDVDEPVPPLTIWASSGEDIGILHRLPLHASRMYVPPDSTAPTNRLPMQGFFGTRGVVTFNGSAFGTNFIFVQKDTTVVRVSLDNPAFGDQLKVGQRVDLGGALDTTKDLPTLIPLIAGTVGWAPMPSPILRPLASARDKAINGRWVEVEGVIHGVRTNGMLAVSTRDGICHVWLTGVERERLEDYIDAKVRVRGVMLLRMAEAPVLLTPSLLHFAVEEEPQNDPFSLPRQPVVHLTGLSPMEHPAHRIRVEGQITYKNSNSFFVQDRSGGIRVQMTPGEVVPNIGNTVNVVAFVDAAESMPVLIDAMVRPSQEHEELKPTVLNLDQSSIRNLKGTLVQAFATLLGVRTNREFTVFELQQQQRVFSAIMNSEPGPSPAVRVGSRVKVTGILDYGSDMTSTESGAASTVAVLMRDATDLSLVSGPPWWTWKRAAALFGILVLILVVTLLWVQLLHRRLERQESEQFAFSKRVLERVEDERRRIAANLHDSLGQTLLVIKNQAIMAGHIPPEPELKNRLDEISRATSTALEEIRQITHGLRPYQLDRLGLTHAIRALVTRASETTSILFACRIEPIDDLFDPEAEINIYRVLQEAITNVVKHSQATEAAVVIRKRADRISISVRDNGIGFDASKAPPKPYDLGYGLSGISERVRILKGNLSVESREGAGTSLTVEVPLPNSATAL